MLQAIQTYSKEIATITAVFLAYGLNQLFRLRARLVYSVQHAFTFIVDQPIKDKDGNVLAPKQVVHTTSIISTNEGRAAAKSVEFTFNWKPAIFNIYPPRHYTEVESALGRYTIRLDTLAPREIFGIEILTINAAVPALTSVRCDEGEGRAIAMRPQRLWPDWWIRILTFLLLIGIAATIYGVANLIQWIATR